MYIKEMPLQRYSRRDFIPPLLPIQKERHPPFLKPKPCIEILPKGTRVDYKPRGSDAEAKGAVVVGVHGDCTPPYYTIQLDEDKREKQVEACCLTVQKN